MRDDQVRRYARHILLPDVGGLGQTALMAAAAIVDVRDGDPAALIAASYLAAGGVGTLVLFGATDIQLAELAPHCADTKLVAATEPSDLPDHAREVAIPDSPTWWPAFPGDAVARAHWRGGLAATTWMAAVATR